MHLLWFPYETKSINFLRKVMFLYYILVLCSQFSDIYQEETFMNMLRGDIDIVKELPPHLKSTDFEVIGSLVRRLFPTFVLATVVFRRKNV